MLLSIGLPFYNAEKTLGAAIRSIFAQSITDWELILVDDGSIDGSAEIAQAVAESDSRVSFTSDGVNRQLSFRLNQIAQLANGYYLARMDADDLMHPERMAQQVAVMEENPTVDILGTGLCTIDANNVPLSIHHYEISDSILKSLFEHRLIMHPTVLGRSQWFRQNPYDGEYVRAQDQELWARTHKRTRFANMQQTLLYYRVLSAEDEKEMGRRLQDYIKSWRTERRLYRMYGPEVSRSFTVGVLGKSYLTEIGYRSAAKLGLQNALRQRLMKTRFQPINRQQQAIASRTIQQILDTPVPGLAQDEPELTTH